MTADECILDAVRVLRRRGDAVDLVTVADELERRGRLRTVGGLPAVMDWFDRPCGCPYAAIHAHQRAACRYARPTEEDDR